MLDYEKDKKELIDRFDFLPEDEAVRERFVNLILNMMLVN